MSDQQGDSPEESTPTASTPSESTPAATADAAPAASAPSQPAAPATPAASPTPPPAPQPPYVPAAPAGALPPRPVWTGSAPAGGPGVPPAAPQGTHPTVPYPGAAFGAPTSAQQTLPIVDRSEPAKRKGGAGKVVGLIVAAALVGGAAGLGGAYAGVSIWGGQTVSPAAGPSTITVNDTDSVNATTAIAANVVPSVVTISASSSSSGGTGSGVILSEDGYVLTNTHVVTLDGATADASLSVTTSDGRVYQAELVGTDPTYDLAVIKLVDAEDLTPIEWGDSTDLNVGDATVAVGAPLGLSNTVTTGIVSALNRSIQVASSAAPDGDESDDEQPQQEEESPFFFDFGQGQQQGTATETISIAVIQTDAAINPGNSGGALVDDEGRLIGINVAIASTGGSSSSSSAGSIGVGFAIPSSVAERVANELIENGTATHGLLGASVQPAASVEGTEYTGAYIQSVVDGGAAAEAGLQAGDIVTAFNGLPITDATDLTAQVRAAAAGSEATVTVVRDGESRTVDVTLGALE